MRIYSNAVRFKVFLSAFLLVMSATTFMCKPQYHSLSANLVMTLSSNETIQQAVDSAHADDTVLVPSGVYYDRVMINKSISLIGEEGCIIDGNNSKKIMFQVNADNVTVTGFRFQNSGYGWNVNGIYVNHVTACRIVNNTFSNVCHDIRLENSSRCKITENKINGTMYGIRVINSTKCVVSANRITRCVGAIHLQGAINCTTENNTLYDNPGQAIRLYTPCVDDLMIENYISNNSYAGMIALMPGGSDYTDNMFLHNNFINNNNTFIIQCNGTAWDDSCEGNYWSGYNGTDADQNGIGDSPYHLAMGEDTFPLIAPCYTFHFQINGVTHTMWIVSNAVIKEFDYSLAANGSKISFKTHTANSSLSNRFFRITIPSEVTKHQFTLEVDGVQIQNSTLRFMVQNPQKSLAVFYFTLSADEHDYTFFIALLIGVVITVALSVILMRKRYRTKHQK